MDLPELKVEKIIFLREIDDLYLALEIEISRNPSSRLDNR